MRNRQFRELRPIVLKRAMTGKHEVEIMRSSSTRSSRKSSLNRWTRKTNISSYTRTSTRKASLTSTEKMLPKPGTSCSTSRASQLSHWSSRISTLSSNATLLARRRTTTSSRRFTSNWLKRVTREIIFSKRRSLAIEQGGPSILHSDQEERGRQGSSSRYTSFSRKWS